MYQEFENSAADRQQANHFIEFAFGLAALAALGFGLVIHIAADALPFTDEARRVVSWSFIGLAALDAALLVTWRRLILRLAGKR